MTDAEKRSVVRAFRFGIPLIIGLAIGFVWADAVMWHKNNGLMERVDKVPGLSMVLYVPGYVLFRACLFLNLGPSGEAAWDMLPWCIIAGWIAIGGGTGILLLWRHERRSRSL